MKLIATKSIPNSVKLAGAVLISAALLAGCSTAKQAEPFLASANEMLVKTVKAAPIEKKTISAPTEQVAEVVSSLQIDVIAKAGGDVQEILKKRGDSVVKGDVILLLDQTDVLLQKDKTQVALASSQEQLTKARRDLEDGKVELKNGITKLELTLTDAEKSYNKKRNDYDMGTATKNDLEMAETGLKTLRLDLDNTRNKLSTLEKTNSLAQLDQAIQTANLSLREIDRTIENMSVKANADGVITDFPVETGMTISPEFNTAKIQMMDPIKIKAELTETAASLIRGKTELSFYVPNTIDRTKAKVKYLADVMSAQSQSYSLELEVPNADRKLKPGMKAQVLLTEEKDEVVVAVPSLTVVREGSDTFVYVLTGDQVEKRKIELGRLKETYQEVLSGVKEGEQLIISGQHQLKDKDKVKVVQ
ncbi:efflux RND transporter periplasmic adaptor subunit [Paenibacillus alba]|uniref:efflux RND transporter periplasmic adaptor subunit n=1 Tax=Paenibacillus alba TaxID=1197127 RepID=UPI0015677321|nr:efflux RND transporter periplasmic adaptor subunit [Paenibacillus alba]NQX68001.1 efflux RND transporter periplasmic adaptor subunit [Paenibacillus alba]